MFCSASTKEPFWDRRLLLLLCWTTAQYQLLAGLISGQIPETMFMRRLPPYAIRLGDLLLNMASLPKENIPRFE
jgi:hypothetical protein